jgi:Glycosyl transferases group 1
MRVIFITLVAINDIDEKNIYTDLIRYFVMKGHFVTIYSPVERRQHSKNVLYETSSYKIVRVKIPNIQKANIFEKTISTFLIDYLLLRDIKKYEKNNRYDLILYSTPPVTLTRTIDYLKKKFNARTYLLLKDIFPQNAVDLGFFSERSFIYKYFRKKEIQLYQLSDKIGCMSLANVNYVLKHNDFILESKVEICPNSIAIDKDFKKNIKENNELIRERLSIPHHSRVFIYGGNLGKPQGIDFLIQFLEQCKDLTNAFFVIIGSGTEYLKLHKWVKNSCTRNVILHEYLPKEEYDAYVKMAHIGIISLDFRFTIPNYPSRLLTYLEHRKPVICFTDENTDVGINAETRQYGKWCRSNDVAKAKELVKYFCECTDDDLSRMGTNGFNYLNSHYNVENTYEIIKNAM